MGTGKSSLVLRFVKGQFLEFQVILLSRVCGILDSLFFFSSSEMMIIGDENGDCLQESTIGAAFFSSTVAVNNNTVKFEIWDTAGQERYHSLAPMYYRGAAAAIIVFDITSAVLFYFFNIENDNESFIFKLSCFHF